MKRYMILAICLLTAAIALAAPGDKHPAVSSTAIGLGISSDAVLGSVTSSGTVTAPAYASSAADGYHYLLPYNSGGFLGTSVLGMIQTTPTAPQWYNGTAWKDLAVLPDQTDNSGKYLTTNGSTTSWATVSAGDSLPSQTGNSGKYLTTNGTTASWGTIAAGSGIAISTDIPTDTGAANLNDTTHVLTIASSTGYTQFTGSFTAWDTTPDAFSFTDETDVALSTAKTSNAITVAGINYPAAISVTGDTGCGYSKNSAACTATSGTVIAGDTVAACVTSSGSNSTETTATVTIGGVSDTYSVTTVAGSSYNDILFYWNAENTLVADIGGVTGTSSNDTFTATAKVGTYALARSTNYGNVAFSITSTQLDPAGGQIGFWYQSTGYQAGSANNIVKASYDATNNLLFMQHSSGGIKVQWTVGGTNYVTEYTTTGLTADTWYYITYKWHPGDAGNDAVLTIYNADGSTFGTASLATLPSMSQPATLLFGNTTGDAGRPIVDHFAVSNDITRDMWAIQASGF